MDTAVTTMPRPLNLVRLPGEHGPVLRCSGELTVATVELLRRELDLLVAMGHPVLTLNLTGCSHLDVDGILVVLDTVKRLHEDGRRLVLVAGSELVSRLLQVLGIGWIVPLFPSEDTAGRALRGGGDAAPAAGSWDAARQETLAHWTAIYKALDYAPAGEVERLLTSMHSLCRRAEAIEEEAGVGTRCVFCPLFKKLGGRRADVGCESLLQPILGALRARDRATAKAQVTDAIRLIESMTLPGGPAPSLESRSLATV